VAAGVNSVYAQPQPEVSATAIGGTAVGQDDLRVDLAKGGECAFDR
jgi:hypothetical protein